MRRPHQTAIGISKSRKTGRASGSLLLRYSLILAPVRFQEWDPLHKKGKIVYAGPRACILALVWVVPYWYVLSYQRAASSYWWINFPLPNTVLMPGFFGSIWILTSLITLIYDALSSPGILPLSHRMTHFSPILSEEHDSIPRWEAIVKMEAYSRMLDKVQTNDERMTRSRPGKIVGEGRLTPRNSRVKSHRPHHIMGSTTQFSRDLPHFEPLLPKFSKLRR